MIRVHREVVQVHPKYALPSLVGNNGTAYFGGQLANEPHHATESSSKRLKHKNQKKNNNQNKKKNHQKKKSKKQNRKEKKIKNKKENEWKEMIRKLVQAVLQLVSNNVSQLTHIQIRI